MGEDRLEVSQAEELGTPFFRPFLTRTMVPVANHRQIRG